MGVAWIWLSGLAFAVVHSLLAADSVKRYAEVHGISRRAYRLGYTVLALAMTALWLGFVHQLPDKPLYRIGDWGKWALGSLQLTGVWIVLLSIRAIDVKIFLGLAPMPRGGEPFYEHGIYRHMRHPMYTGVMLVLFASPIQTVNSLNFCVAVSLYLLIGSKFEERRLLDSHAEYAAYRRRVPAFVPRLGKRQTHG